MATTMGQIIKKLRKARGFTQEELAERIGVTYQAVSKWENGLGMPDISQIVPLASVFDVSTDVLFGIDKATETEEVMEIISAAEDAKVYGKADTYLKAYDILAEGLRRHPDNLMLMNNCVGLGVALAMPENGRMYAGERAGKIISETIRRAELIISGSKNVGDIMRARQCLLFLYSASGKYDLAAAEARKLPVRTDFTLCSNMARVCEYAGDFSGAARYLCTDIDYSLQTFEDNVARLGKAYYNSGRYTDAIDVYETFFAVMKAIFKDKLPPPYHDFDSGDCYLLLAKAYLTIGDEDKAMDAVENSVMYYIEAIESGEKINTEVPLVKNTELEHCICKDAVKEKLLEKLADKDIYPLCKTEQFKKLSDIINNL